jgi:hypothetical protein
MSTTQTTEPQVSIGGHYPETYTIKTASGYSCLGFDVLEQRYIRLHAELLANGLKSLNEFPEERGTIARYHQYQRLMSHARSLHDQTGYRFKCELVPQLIGLEGKRVELIYPNGEKTRFIVGKSTGWIPIHLEIKTKRSSGGGSVYFPKGTQLRIVG